MIANPMKNGDHFRGPRFQRGRDIRGGEGRGGTDIPLEPVLFLTVEAMLPVVTKTCHIKLRNTRLLICNTGY